MNDKKQRLLALDPKQSFIVQAPAGSGKTELLSQRFLNLLTTVDKNPEEVLAITFTRKAVHEMRQRILSALKLATQTRPKLEHKIKTWEIARQVLQIDKKFQWNLMENPNRLRIQTIDSLCSYLSKQMPIASQLGSDTAIVEKFPEAYQLAVDNTLQHLEENKPWSSSIEMLLSHLDNDLNLVKELLVEMLERRDQWLPHIIHSRNNQYLREHLELALKYAIEETLIKLKQYFPDQQKQEMLELLNYSQADNEKSLEFPTESINDLQHWKTLATLLLTQKHEWRKSFDKRIGFPVDSKDKEQKQRQRSYKNRITELVTTFHANEALRLELEQSLGLPESHYTDSQWKILTALLDLLPIASAQLNVIFQEYNHIDFIEMTQRALQALEQEESPTELALCLDYKIKHILVDEFQDTSATQSRLLKLLTQGWQENDGQSLFIVGDPMQSIYRFRAAEVGLFLQAKQYGIGNIKLTPLTLSTNFRSTPSLVAWYNTIFKQAFPAKDDMALGAISYSPAVSVDQEDQSESTINFHHCDEQNSEANTIVNIIETCLAKDPKQSIAILVRSRSQLFDIIPTLEKAEINFQAVEIETLAHLPLIQDLTSLTLALTHFANRLAWLSILRAPWCGLSLHDLHIIANEPDITIWESLQKNQTNKNLSNIGQAQIQNFIRKISMTLKQYGKMTLSDWIYSTWLILAGPATLNHENELKNSHAFFNLLTTLEQGGQLKKIDSLKEKLSQLFAIGNPDSCNVQIMTIHKAKGLEFDTVIMPGLQSSSAQDKPKLLLWRERTTSDNHVDLLLAPIKNYKDNNDSIYDYVKCLEQRKNRFEKIRLFYVAATRAKKTLHFLASIEKEDYKPRKDSFLSILWKNNKQYFKRYLKSETNDNAIEHRGNLKRLKQNYQLPEEILNYVNSFQTTENFQNNMPIWQDTAPRQIGIIIHFLLQKLALTDKEMWEKQLNDNKAWEILLLQEGLVKAKINDAMDIMKIALNNVINSKKAHWILHNHQDAHCEYPLTWKNDNKFKNIIIDRTFIANNIRWIIDYKSSQPNESELINVFLQREKDRYQQQLEIYAQALSENESLPIKLGLYFPLIDAWIEWEYNILN